MNRYVTNGAAGSGSVHVPIDEFYAAMERKHRTWEDIAQQGGEPIAVLSDGGRGAGGRRRNRDRTTGKTCWRFLLDLVPIDEIGEVVAELEETLR